MSIEKLKPFDYAQDVTKQLLTLSTAVVTITVAFIKDIAKNAPDDARYALYGAWVLFALTIVFGTATLLNLTGRVGRSDATPGPTSIEDSGIRSPAIAQIVCFFLAVVATIYFGARAFDSSTTSCTTTTTLTRTISGGSTQTVSTADC